MTGIDITYDIIINVIFKWVSRNHAKGISKNSRLTAVYLKYRPAGFYRDLPQRMHFSREQKTPLSALISGPPCAFGFEMNRHAGRKMKIGKTRRIIHNRWNPILCFDEASFNMRHRPWIDKLCVFD